MKRMSRRAILTVLIIAAVLIVLVGNRIWQRSRRPASKSISELQSEIGIPVSVSTVGLGDISESIELTGTVQGIVQSDLISKMTERVVSVNAGVGARVVSGQVLVVFDDSNPTAQYRQAKAALENAERDYSRMKVLLEQGAVSEQVFEAAESGLEVARANFEAARSMVEAISPIDGVLTSMNVHPGETVPVGTVVCTVARVDRVKVVVAAAEAELRKLSSGAPALVRTSGASEIAGTVSMLSSSADPGNRTFRVEVTADNTSRVLRPGSFATVSVQTANKKGVLTVPSDAIVTREGKQGVFVVSSDGKAEFRTVRVGIVNSKSTEIREGLEEGQRMVTKGYELLKGGETLNIIQ